MSDYLFDVLARSFATADAGVRPALMPLFATRTPAIAGPTPDLAFIERDEESTNVTAPDEKRVEPARERPSRDLKKDERPDAVDFKPSALALPSQSHRNISPSDERRPGLREAIHDEAVFARKPSPAPIIQAASAQQPALAARPTTHRIAVRGHSEILSSALQPSSAIQEDRREPLESSPSVTRVEAQPTIKVRALARDDDRVLHRPEHPPADTTVAPQRDEKPPFGSQPTLNDRPPAVAPIARSVPQLDEPIANRPSPLDRDRMRPFAVQAHDRSGRAERLQQLAETTVEITIGRIEVRAPARPEPPKRVARPAAANLDEYLRRRSERSRA
jgi:hypothetical protein